MRDDARLTSSLGTALLGAKLVGGRRVCLGELGAREWNIAGVSRIRGTDILSILQEHFLIVSDILAVDSHLTYNGIPGTC